MPKCPCCNENAETMIYDLCPKCKQQELFSILEEHHKAFEQIRYAEDSREKSRKLYNTRVKQDTECTLYYLSIYERYFENTQELISKAREIEANFIQLMYPDKLNRTLDNATAHSTSSSIHAQDPGKDMQGPDRS